jgi:putative endonuclease
MSSWVYIMASKPRGTLYTGVTCELVHRAWQHRDGEIPDFTSKYRVHMLVWYEEHSDIRDAIQREKNIKHWVRQWKVDLVENMNPKWEDLWGRITR